MLIPVVRRLTPVLLLFVAALALAEQPDAETKPKAKAPGDEKKTPAPPTTPAPKKADAPRLPGDAIYVIAEQAADALRMLPRAIVVPPEKYKEWMDEIDRLKAQLRPDRPQPPFKCLLKGKIEGNAAQLQGQFECPTDRPGAAVALGCSPARATNVTSTGAPPLLRADTDGFSVHFEQSGKHSVTLDLVAELTGRGGERVLGLDLPRAAITRVEVELPAGAREVRLNGKPLPEIAGASLKNSRLEAELGAATRLDITWRDAVGPGTGIPLLTAEGRLIVRADEKQVTTTAELTLRAQGIPVKDWRLLVPAGAEIRPVEDEGRVQAIEPADQPQAILRTIKLKEPSAAPLKLIVTARAPLPRPGNRLALGPVHVVGATRHTGTILVANAAAGEVRLLLNPLAEATRIETRDAAYQAAFSYVANSPERVPAPATPLNAWLELDTDSIRGLVEAKVGHALRLQRDAGGRYVWRAQTTLDATPVRSGVDHLEVQLAANCAYDDRRGPRPPELVRDVEYDAARRVVKFRLAHDPLKAFQLHFDTSYGEPVEGAGKAALTLPRPLEVRDRGGNVAVAVPDELMIVAPAGANPALDITQQNPQNLSCRSERIPERVEVAWSAYRPEVRVRADADLTLGAREGRVRHEYRLEFPQSTPTHLAVSVPPSVAGTLIAAQGAELLPADEAMPGKRILKLLGIGGTDVRVVLEYAFALTGATPEGPVAVPLVAVADAVSSETKVRVWSESGLLPLPASTSWTECNVEEVKGRDRLPVLVLRTPRGETPLALRLGTAAEGEQGATLLIARALVRANVSEGGLSFHASYLLRQMAAPWLDVELPAPPSAVALRVTLDGKQVSWELNADEPRLARLRIGNDLLPRPAVLDIRYQAPHGAGSGGLMQCRLQPPVLRGASPYLPTRWSFTAPPGWLVLSPEAGPGAERSWGRRGWLLASRLTTTPAELERWFAGAESAPRSDADGQAVAAHVCWRTGPEAVTLVLVTQQAWLLLCSLGVLVLGFVLDQLSRPSASDPLRPSAWFLPALALLALGLAIGWLLYPTLVSAILTGSQVGVVVLAVYLAVQWLRRERYRRQVVFLSSFARGPKGSSLARKTGSSIRPHREPSTVDSPNDQDAAAEGGS